MISLIFGKKKKAIKLREKEIIFVVTRGGGGVGKGNWRKVVQRYKLPVIREISPRDVMYNMMTIVNTAVWYISNLLSE